MLHRLANANLYRYIFEFSDTKDNGKMKRIFSSMPLKQIELAINKSYHR